MAHRTQGLGAEPGLGAVSMSEPYDQREAQLTTLFEGHRLWLVRLAVLLVDDQGVAEDVVQSAYLGMFRNWRHRDDAQAIAYLRTSVVNGSRSTLRKRKVDRRHLSAVSDDDALTAQPDRAPGPEAAVELDKQRRRVLGLVRHLPARQREVLVLTYWAELPEAEIASLLDISAGTVKSTASRGITALAQRWEEGQ
ncbi:MAG: subfamily polymerase sigma-24 subunit [Pseudonocardiales bacterium]|nr:subfamily polymerase sigma-24 subunit [Pseudonocardiales bacterium]